MAITDYAAYDGLGLADLVRRKEVTPAELLEAAIEAGADDCAVEEEQHVISCEMNALVGVSQALAKAFGDPASAKFVWRTEIAIPIEGDGAEQLMKLIDYLDDLDDVQDVYSNEDISDEEMARLSA